MHNGFKLESDVRATFFFHVIHVLFLFVDMDKNTLKRKECAGEQATKEYMTVK